ncbi:hypothetical protein NQ318_006072 [Aromia moschata]|uniref:HTH CENPB-type domain-containing protein n=1 Tax=Aromia moschata TaxID=1265417 RepID=A0AAV8Z3U2_9CUCU|nr:hypothetical protein NQ318_006072 [Aromia moschata]
MYSDIHQFTIVFLRNVHFLWFCQKKSLGEPMTGPVLQAKAKQFHASLNVDSNFSASNGWLARFKKRHGIRCLNIKGEKLSANKDDASAFRERLLKAFLENHGYKLDNTYNGDETSLFWKHFPTKTFVCRNETEAQGRKASKDRVTIQLHLAGPVQTQTVAGLLGVIRRIPGCGEMSLKEVENWIDKDQYEPPYKVFNDSQLIEIAKGGIEESDSEEEFQ